ncbi:hypothetical protein AAW51_5252 [Caldimonas brevitalea]|uniref:Uncharacterized protein n=1 Tax=Caldimonas brevitalea TaxID=413882 RepID=A0A0G3BV83_9BURK|nr:hypothetical protein AAW51_5252 [Caldimonas brevitalea]
MLDADDLLFRPVSLLLVVLRACWWLAWDFCVQTIGWSIGWAVYRLLTLGRFPSEGVFDADEASGGVALVVEVTGLAVLASAIWYLSGQWPN